MPTMKDIARLAGVSHGTVSNVLNGKGNVSLKKIKLVEQAASQLGYTVNKQAKHLRKSIADTFALILPCLKTPEYIELYDAIRQHLAVSRCKISLYVTDNIPVKELDIIKNLDIERLCGIAVVTSLKKDQLDIYSQLVSKNIKVLFVERKPRNGDFSYLGFDMKQASADIGQRISDSYRDIRSIGIFTLNTAYFPKEHFLHHLKTSTDISTLHIKTDMQLAFTHAFSFFEQDRRPDIIITTHIQLADKLQKVCRILKLEDRPKIISLAPSSRIPHDDILHYSLNYGQLGHIIGSKILCKDMPEEQLLLTCDGFAKKYSCNLKHEKRAINVITLNSPATQALTQLTPAFTKETGIDVNFAVFSHDELYNIISEMENHNYYDVIRLDVAWLSWFAEKVLIELDFNSMGFDHIKERIIPNVLDNFSIVNGKSYALPFDLSIQLLFYRKDLFDNTMIKRMYYEHTKSSLEVPNSYRDFNDVSRFFTKSYNAMSPVDYGTVMPLGNTSLITDEYLSRLHDFTNSNLKDCELAMLDDEMAVKALKNLKEAFLYSVSTTDDTWWTHSAQYFAEGKAAQIVIFMNYATDIINSRSSQVFGNVGYSPVPGNRPTVGGGTLGISKYSRKREESIEFLKWISNDETATNFSYLGGVAPYESVFLNNSLQSLYPWLTAAREGIIKGSRKRLLDRSNTTVEEKKIIHMLGMAIKNYLHNITNEAETLLQAKSSIDRFMTEYCP